MNLEYYSHNIEDQICSFEQGKKLQQLGLDLDSYFIWDSAIPIANKHDDDNPEGKIFTRKDVIYPKELCIGTIVPGYTVAELGILLPSNEISIRKLFNLHFDKVKDYFRVHMESFTYAIPNQWFINKNEAIVKAECLIWLLEKELINPKELRL